MSNGTLVMTPELMEERAKQYQCQADAVGGVIREMDVLLRQLQDEWKGSASDKYAQKFSELRPSFLQTEELIREIAVFLVGAAEKTRQTDIELNQSI